MKHANVKLLLGLGIGAAVGAAIGYYMASDKGKLKEDVRHAVDEVKEGVKSAYSKVKTKAMAMYLHVAFGIFILDHSRSIPGYLFFKPYGVSEYDP